MSKFFIYLVIIALTFNLLKAVNTDSCKTINIYKSAIIPLSLIGVGVAVNKSDFEKRVRKDIRNFVGNDFRTHIDDYLTVVPVVEMYTADALGVKSLNHWFDQSKYLFMSNLLSSTITASLKIITKKSRPEGEDDSFPSGHSTFAFTNAAVLFNEFNDTSPYLAYSGYLVSTSVGLLRMMNDRHWLSDVLVGAGIGIISTEIIYYFEPLKNFNPFKDTENMSFSPIIDETQYGLYFTYKF